MSRVANALRPKNDMFFSLFEAAGHNVVIAAGLLDEMLRAFPDRPELAEQVRDCEHRGDEITHELVQRLNNTFITPIDRDDIYELSSALDNIVDLIEEVADYLGLYCVPSVMSEAKELARVLGAACRQIADALARLSKFPDLREQTIEVHRLENEGDRIVRKAIASLFANGDSALDVLRWKDLLERLEQAIDATECAAFIIEGIMLKNA